MDGVAARGLMSERSPQRSQVKLILAISLDREQVVEGDDVVAGGVKEGDEGAEEFVGAVAAVVEEDYCAVVEAF